MSIRTIEAGVRTRLRKTDRGDKILYTIAGVLVVAAVGVNYIRLQKENNDAVDYASYGAIDIEPMLTPDKYAIRLRPGAHLAGDQFVLADEVYRRLAISRSGCGVGLDYLPTENKNGLAPMVATVRCPQ